MEVMVLAKREFSTGTLFTVSCTLREYLNNIPSDSNTYEIQREIVKNVYLDALAETLFNDDHIPNIVLVADDKYENIGLTKLNDLQILDGLQRTTRLQAIYAVLNENIEKTNSANEQILKIQQSGPVGAEIIRQARNQIAKKLASGETLTKMLTAFDRIQHFEVWFGLSYEQKVRRMLLLNAGHKSVSVRHQLELLFLTWLPQIKTLSGNRLHIYREKERPSIRFSKERVAGDFHFSHLMAGILALAKGRPVTTNADLIMDIKIGEVNDKFFEEVSNESLIVEVINLLIALDNAAIRSDIEARDKWAGREIVIVGVLAAIGCYAKKNSMEISSALRTAAQALERLPTLNLERFEASRNSLDLSKINIGNVNKNAVFNGMTAILNGSFDGSWAEYFAGY